MVSHHSLNLFKIYLSQKTVYFPIQPQTMVLNFLSRPSSQTIPPPLFFTSQNSLFLPHFSPTTQPQILVLVTLIIFYFCFGMGDETGKFRWGQRDWIGNSSGGSCHRLEEQSRGSLFEDRFKTFEGGKEYAFRVEIGHAITQPYKFYFAN